MSLMQESRHSSKERTTAPTPCARHRLCRGHTRARTQQFPPGEYVGHNHGGLVPSIAGKMRAEQARNSCCAAAAAAAAVAAGASPTIVSLLHTLTPLAIALVPRYSKAAILS
ncbi:unnamed protein product, partial [Ectocarpus sp. 13 AM-2016]